MADEASRYIAGTEDQAAVRVQSVYRGRQSRQQVAGMRVAQQFPDDDPDMQGAAVRVQSAYRGRQSRQQVAGMRTARFPPANLPGSARARITILVREASGAEIPEAIAAALPRHARERVSPLSLEFTIRISIL